MARASRDCVLRAPPESALSAPWESALNPPWESARSTSWESARSASRESARSASVSTTEWPLPSSARASAAPTGPPPAISMSTASGIAHQGFYVGDALRRFGANDLAAVLGHQHIVLDAHADIPVGFRYVIRGTNVAAGLDGEHHACRERPPFAI